MAKDEAALVRFWRIRDWLTLMKGGEGKELWGPESVLAPSVDTVRALELRDEARRLGPLDPAEPSVAVELRAEYDEAVRERTIRECAAKLEESGLESAAWFIRKMGLEP
jgi:hypothetical protein